MPFSLSALQQAANQKHGLGAQAVLDIAQELYEAKVTTYPRTDCAYLPESQRAEAEAVLGMLPAEYAHLGQAGGHLATLPVLQRQEGDRPPCHSPDRRPVVETPNRINAVAAGKDAGKPSNLPITPSPKVSNNKDRTALPRRSPRHSSRQNTRLRDVTEKRIV